MLNQRQQKQITFIIVISYFLIVLVYAYIRYVVFFGLDFLINANFIINKAFAGAAVLSVCTAYMLSSLGKVGNIFARKHQGFKRFFGLSGFYYMCLHVFFGFRIISPDLLPQFFDDNGIIALRGQIIILLGATGFILFLFPAISSMNDIMKKLGARKWQIVQRFGYTAFFIIMIHASLIGYNNWLTPHLWHGGMPPITLICVSLIFMTLVLRLYVLIRLRK
jgi:DMSO/TMAO reductase YedYZ heme-binding membrane subunit